METLDEETSYHYNVNHVDINQGGGRGVSIEHKGGGSGVDEHKGKGSVSNEDMIESLQAQVRTLENDVREFKCSLNGKISNIMEILQDIKQQNLHSDNSRYTVNDDCGKDDSGGDCCDDDGGGGGGGGDDGVECDVDSGEFLEHSCIDIDQTEDETDRGKLNEV